MDALLCARHQDYGETTVTLDGKEAQHSESALEPVQSSNPGPGRRAAVISRVVKVQGRRRRGRGNGGGRRKKKNTGKGNGGGEGGGSLAVTKAGEYTRSREGHREAVASRALSRILSAGLPLAVRSLYTPPHLPTSPPPSDCASFCLVALTSY